MEKIKALKEKLLEQKKLVIVVFIGILGMLLICLSEVLPNKATSSSDAEEQETESISAASFSYCDTLEKKLESVLKEMDGVGRCKVLLTLDSSDEKIYATDEKTNSKSSDNTSERTLDSKYVRTNSKDGKEGIILKTKAPKIKGVLIVCDGGDNAAVENAVTEAVCATLGIASNAVSVLKMKT